MKTCGFVCHVNVENQKLTLVVASNNNSNTQLILTSVITRNKLDKVVARLQIPPFNREVLFDYALLFKIASIECTHTGPSISKIRWFNLSKLE
jgi:hypothetical protein